MKEKVCVTTYVYGDKYQLYVPIAVWSIKKMYPEYDVIIFLHGKLNDELRSILMRLNLYDKIIIKEQTFSDCPRMNSNKARALRWVLWDRCFLNYDYLYIIDIDMFYIKEPIPLHEQHIYHMQNVTGLPFDNMRRVVQTEKFSLKRQLYDFAVFVKNFGVRYIFDFLYRCRENILLLSGLHFVDVRKYYNVFTEEKIQCYVRSIYDGSYVKNMHTVNDEAFLYRIVKELGFNVNKLAAQDFVNAPYVHTDFDNYDKELFRPTHGIHLGNYRDGFPKEKIECILSLKSERYYKWYIENVLLKENDFIEFLNILPENILVYFRRYFEFTGIHVDI